MDITPPPIQSQSIQHPLPLSSLSSSQQHQQSDNNNYRMQTSSLPTTPQQTSQLSQQQQTTIPTTISSSSSLMTQPLSGTGGGGTSGDVIGTNTNNSGGVAGLQTLQANMITKQTGSGSMEVITSNNVKNDKTFKINRDLQYMQQQSQIFVFSTSLANKGAECVINGHYTSIIAFHCAQPGTKKFLEVSLPFWDQFSLSLTFKTMFFLLYFIV